MNVAAIKYIKACVACCLLAVSFSANSAPLDFSDTAAQELLRQQERLRLLREQQEIKPEARDAGDQLQQVAPITNVVIPEHENPCFTIHQISLIGDKANKFQFALDQVISTSSLAVKEPPILGRCLGVIGINAVMSRVQNVIIAKGYTTTRVLAAPQDLTSGMLQLTIIPGRILGIRLTPESSQRVSLWNALPLRPGDILNLRDIEQGLENFKRIPTAEVDIQIAPATESQDQESDEITQANPLLGYSDIVIRYQQRLPFRVSISLDDAGSSSIGKYQGNMTLSGDNLLILNDLFYVNYQHDLGGGDSGKRGNDGYSAHYSIPWDYWLLSATTSSNDFYQQVAGISQAYIFRGTSQFAEVHLSRLIHRNNVNKSIVSLKGFLNKSNNYIDDTEIELQRRRTAGWELRFNQSWFIGKAILDYNLAYRRGTGAERALKAPEEPFGEGASHMKLWLADLNFSVPFQVGTPWGVQALQYTARIRAQNNRTPLTPQERFSIGNRYTVRGFDGQQTLLADNGWFVRNDLNVALGASGQTVYWGVDYGQVGGQSADYLLGKHLAGTVMGLRGGGGNHLGRLSYDVFLGKPLNKPKGFTTHEATAGFSFNYAY